MSTALRFVLRPAAAAFLAAGLLTSGAALSADGDDACAACHASAGMTKKLGDGAELSLTVDAAAFARSVHSAVGCASCHSDVQLPDHPGKERSIKSARDYTAAQSQACRACHDKIAKTFEASIHGVRLHEGNAAAPACADCHKPHDVRVEAVQQAAQGACANCHGDPADQHEKWLPNAASHLSAVACGACHAPDALRRVDLRVYVGGKSLRDGDGQFEKRARAADANHDGLDAAEFRALLASLTSSGDKATLHGRVELRNAIEAHELPPKAGAIRDCVACHDEHAAPFQSVTVSVLDAEGKALRYDARKEILSSPLTMEALRGFYAIGGTRIKLMDVLLALGLIGGISVPALHLVVRRFMGRRSQVEGDKQ